MRLMNIKMILIIQMAMDRQFSSIYIQKLNLKWVPIKMYGLDHFILYNKVILI